MHVFMHGHIWQATGKGPVRPANLKKVQLHSHSMYSKALKK